VLFNFIKRRRETCDIKRGGVLHDVFSLYSQNFVYNADQHLGYMGLFSVPLGTEALQKFQLNT
jgi:hypothetical protein